MKFKILISGGGSGGHVFPAIAIANALTSKYPGKIEILFVGAKGKIEMRKVPSAGYKIEGLWISGLQRRLSVKNLLFPLKLFCSLLKAFKIINRFKPDIVIGVGGFASGPILRVAANKKIPTLIQEQNSYPGITNRLLAKNVDIICVAYENLEKYFPKEKIYFTGNPIRQDIISKVSKEEALKYFGLKSHKPVVLIIGGSLGALTINESIHLSVEQLVNNNIQVIWQTGKNYYSIAYQIAKIYEQKGVRVLDFIDNINNAYSAADIVVSRAGAIAISELCAVAKPAILIPSPNVTEDHQSKNALALVRKNAAILIKDNEAKSILSKAIIDLINDKNLQEVLRKNIQQMAITDSAERIAEKAIKLILNKKN